MTSNSHNQNFAETFFNSNVTALILPPTLWILAWVLQQRLNITIGIEDNQNIIQITTGIRLLAGLVFGALGLVSLTVGCIVWFAFVASDQYTLSFEMLSFLSIVYSLVVFLAIKLLEKARSHDENYSQFRTSDLLILVFLTTAVNTFIKLLLVPSKMNVPFFEVFALQFAGRFIGGMLTLYVLMGVINFFLLKFAREIREE